MGRELILDSIKLLQSYFRQQTTVPANKVLLLYREPGVLDHYRLSDKPWRYYISSILQLHNESTNIWTHLLAILVYFYTVFYYSAEFSYTTDRRSWPVLFFTVTCVVNAALSVTAHTIHSKSPLIHYTCYQADYAGIGFYTLGIGVLLFHCSSGKEWVQFAQPFFLPGMVCLGWLFMVCCCIAKLRYRRPYPFQRRLWQICSGSLIGIFVSIPVIHRYWNCFEESMCSVSSLNHHAYGATVTIISVFFFSSHLPEKIWPGRFDIVGQGHHIFHVLVPVLCVLQIKAAYKDLMEYSASLHVHHVSVFDMLTCTVAYATLCLLTVIALRPLVQRRIAQDLKTG